MKLLLKTLFLLFLTFISMFAHGQSDSISLTIQQALDYALESRIEIQNLIIQEKLAENNIQKAYGVVMPKIDVSLDARDNIVLQTQFVPLFTNLNSNEKIPIKFGTKYSVTAALDFSQPLFDATVFPGLKVARMNENISVQNTKVQKEKIKVEVYQTYYTVLLNKEKLQLSKKNFERNKKSYDDAKVRYENGALLKNDLDKLYLDYRNAETTVKRDQNALRLSEDNLKKTLNIPLVQPIRLTDQLNTEINESKSTQSYEEIEKNSFAEKRSEYQAQFLQHHMSKLSVRQAQNEYFPKLKFYGHVAQQHYSDRLNINTWYPYTYIGFKLDVPIFDGFQKKNNVDELVFQSRIAEKNLEKTKSDIAYEVQTAWVNLHDSYNSLVVWIENIKIAEDLVRLNEVWFKEGNITSTDLISSEATLKDTQTNYMIALYDYLIAKVNWKKATGEL